MRSQNQEEQVIKITYDDDINIDDVLEKARTGLQKREAVKQLRDPYLAKLQRYSNEIYNKIEDAMIEEIVEFLYNSQED